MLNYLHKKYSKILSNLDKHVGLHVRTFARERDSHLLTVPKNILQNSRCSFEYYDKAISHFPKDSVFVVFSDNIDCAKVLLKKYKREFIFIENNPPEEDFYLLSLLKNVIITSSTFAWWAAYLNPSVEKEIVNPWPWCHYSCYGETFIVDGKHAIGPLDWKEYPLGDSFSDGFDDIIREFLAQ